MKTRLWFLVLTLAVVAFALSLVTSNHLFTHFSSNNDEPIYVLQAQAFRHGQVTLPANDHGDFFRPWMSGRHDNHLFLVVQPVLPALLALSDVLFGSMRVALAFIAAAAVIALFVAMRQLLADDRVAIIAAALFALSPLVIVQSALYLTYVLAILLTLLVITLVSQGVKRPSRARLVSAGFVHGFLLFTRPIEGVMLGVALLIWVASEHRVRGGLRMGVTMLVGALPVTALMLVYNKATTGNPLQFPLWAVGGNDSFGFGDRSIAAGAPTVHYGVSEAWLALRTNLQALPHWLFGGLVTVPLAVWGAVCMWKTRRSALVLLGGIAVIYPIGYFFYWGNYLIISGRGFFGPHYYLGLLLPATALMAMACSDLLRRRASVAFLLVPALVLGTFVEVRAKVDANVRIRDNVNGEVAAVRSAVHAPAVVVVPAGADGPYILHPRGVFGNSPDLSDSTLFAADLAGRNLELFDRFPNRRIYRLQVINDGFGGHPDVKTLSRVRAARIDVDIAATATTSRPTITTYAAVADHVTICIVSRAAAPSQTMHVGATVSATAVTLHGCDGGDRVTLLPPTASTITIGAGRGLTTDPGEGEVVEQRYWARPFDNGIEIVTPADIWRRPHPGEEFSVIDPDQAHWVRFTTTAGFS